MHRLGTSPLPRTPRLPTCSALAARSLVRDTVTSCKGGATCLLDGKKPCAAGSYCTRCNSGTGNSGQCAACTAPCAACSSATTCTACTAPRILAGGACVLPAPTKYASIICENASGTLSCASGAISVASSRYGRWVTDTSVCPYSNLADNYHASCPATDIEAAILAYAKSVCDGKSVCTLTPTNGIAGDPCEGIYKYLETTFTCTS